MTSKPKITLLNQNKYLFQHLLRHFQQAIQLTQSGEYLQPPDIFRMLDAMGYLCHQKTQKDYELISSLTYMLAFPKGQGIVSQRNLFHFLTIINSLTGNIDSHFQTNVQALPKDADQLEEPLVQISIGKFDENGMWRVTKDEEKSIRQVFSSMIYTRVSRQDINTNKKREAEVMKKEVFQPKILNRSINIAETRFKRLQLQERVENRLLQAKEITTVKLQAQVRAKQENALKECSFNPRINSKSKYLKENSPYAKEDILILKGQEYQEKLRQNRHFYEELRSNQELSQCSFHPNLASSTSSLRSSYSQEMSYVRNRDKSIQRMKMAREERESLNEFNRRGYPKDRSWVGFMQEVRTKRCNTNIHNHSFSHNSTFSEKPVIFTMDLKILGEQKHVQVKEADDILEMTQRICRNHNINTDNYQKVYNMIEKTLRQSGDALIKNGKVFLCKKK